MEGANASAAGGGGASLPQPPLPSEPPHAPDAAVDPPVSGKRRHGVRGAHRSRSRRRGATSPSNLTQGGLKSWAVTPADGSSRPPGRRGSQAGGDARRAGSFPQHSLQGRWTRPCPPSSRRDSLVPAMPSEKGTTQPDPIHGRNLPTKPSRLPEFPHAGQQRAFEKVSRGDDGFPQGHPLPIAFPPLRGDLGVVQPETLPSSKGSKLHSGALRGEPPWVAVSG